MYVHTYIHTYICTYIHCICIHVHLLACCNCILYVISYYWLFLDLLYSLPKNNFYSGSVSATQEGGREGKGRERGGAR